MSGQIEFDLRFSQPEAETRRRAEQDRPLRILILADFVGAGPQGPDGEAFRLTPHRVDAETYADLMQRLSPQLTVSTDSTISTQFEVQFRTIDDFHPDQLYQHLAIFQALRTARGRLADPTTFAAAARQLGLISDGEPRAETPTSVGPAPEAAAPDQPAEDDATTLNRLLGQDPVERPQVVVPPKPGFSESDVSALIKGLVGPYIIPAEDPRQPELIASVDAAASAEMRALLHHPAFQALETQWRGLDWLVSNVETSAELEIWIANATKQQLRADILDHLDDPGACQLYQLLVENAGGTLGGQPWSLLAGLYEFSPEASDLALLQVLGGLGAAAGAPFVAAADPSFVGCSSMAELPARTPWRIADPEARSRWSALRSNPVAAWIGLVLPRFLLRMPYGEGAEPIEQFPFEELADPAKHEALLWANPAWACIRLIAEAFAERGWSLRLGDQLVIDDLPAHVVQGDGQPQLQACAETYLTDSAAEKISANGIMPLVSYRNRNAVRLLQFQSIADPPAPLSGPWG